MDLDLNRFRTLVPIDTLDEDKIQYLARQVEVEKYKKGALVFKQGDDDEDSLYLMHGEMLLTSMDGQKTRVRSGGDKGLHALASLKPRRYTGQALSDSVTLVRLPTATLDRVLTLGQIAHEDSEGMEVNEFDGPDALDSEWMMTLLQAPSFLKLPAANIQELFSRLEELPVKAGQTIIRQDEKGDYFYLIKQGVAQVSRRIGNAERNLAELNAPHGFGEEALLADKPRNATVTMKTDGVLMRLSKVDFQFLMQGPLVNQVNLSEASKLVRAGALRIDVRSENEYKQGSIKGAVNIPLFLLRIKMTALDRKKKYVLFCDTGSRSSAAAFLMSEKGYDVYVLKGGLASAIKEAKQVNTYSRLS